ncbi:MAG: hypothetical protein ACRDKW_03490 [Actinomycetota bacterium]
MAAPDDGRRNRAALGAGLVVAISTGVFFVLGGFTGARAGGEGMAALGNALLGIALGSLAGVVIGSVLAWRLFGLSTGAGAGRGVGALAACGAAGLVAGFFLATMLGRLLPDAMATGLGSLVFGAVVFTAAGAGAAMGFRFAARR